jgi:pimeloyl-ACP methyl ester carboxylesterase
MKLLVQGREAYAYTGGKPFDAALPCVVFIHGALNDHSVWTLLARWFAHHGHGALAVDLPGHGRSAGEPLPDLQAHAGWLLALLDAAGVERAALVGHSMGSLIALEATGRAPARVSQLVMVGTAYPMQVSAALLEMARTSPLDAIERVNALSLSGLASKPSYPGPGAWLHGAGRALMRRMQAGRPELNLFHHDFSVCDRYADGLQAAANVKCPATLVLGARDQMTLPRSAREIAQALNARVVMLPAGHALIQEQPDGMLAALKEAIR